MRFLNKFIAAITFIAVTTTAVVCEESVIIDPAQSNFELLFGRRFKQEKSLSSNKYLEHNSDLESIRLKSIKYKSNEFARIYIKDRMALFHSVFDIKRVDYPGQYSKTISCPDEFKPKLVEIDSANGITTFYAGFANKNKITGACVADLLEYKYHYGFILCLSKGSLYEFEHYSSLISNNFESFRNELICE